MSTNNKLKCPMLAPPASIYLLSPHSKPTCPPPPRCSDSLSAQRRSLFGLSGHRAGLSCDGPSAGKKPAPWPSARPQRSRRPPRSGPLRLMRSLGRRRAERTAAPQLAARVLSCVCEALQAGLQHDATASARLPPGTGPAAPKEKRQLSFIFSDGDEVRS